MRDREMKPLEQRADVAYMQALLCVEYRIPKAEVMPAAAYLLSLSLRYGVVGAAATHHLLLNSDDQEEDSVYRLAQNWPEMVEEHVRQFVRNRLTFRAGNTVPSLVGQLAYQPVGVALRLYRHFCPLDRCLDAAVEQFAVEHRRAIYQGCPFLQRRRLMREFKEVNARSIEYALHFFDRRQAELEELPEIALIGE